MIILLTWARLLFFVAKNACLILSDVAHLRLLLSEAKGGKDKMILTLSIIIFTVPAMQWVIGLGGMNVHVPNQKDTPYYTYFGIWLASTVVIMVAVIGLVRWWWVRAKRRRKRNNKLA
jgi:magnesium transporter